MQFFIDANFFSIALFLVVESKFVFSSPLPTAMFFLSA